MADNHSTPVRKKKAKTETEKQIRRLRRKYHVRATNKKFSRGEEDAARFQVLVLKLAGYSQRQIAAAVGISQTQVSGFVNEPESQELLVQFRLDLTTQALEMLKLMTVEAAMTVLDVMRTERDGKVRLAAAADVFDRVGIAKVSRSERKTESEETVKFTAESMVEQIRHLSPELQEQAAQMIEQVENFIQDNATVEMEVEAEDE